MPTVNIYYKESAQVEKLNTIAKELGMFLAEKLSGVDITLSTDEISIRIIEAKGSYMVGALEVEIKAHAFRERVDKQDEIANEVRTFLLEKLPDVGDIRVWLVRSELGHSW